MIIKKMEEGLLFLSIKAALSIRRSNIVKITPTSIVAGGERVTVTVTVPHNLTPGIYNHSALAENTLRIRPYMEQGKLTPIEHSMDPDTTWQCTSVQVELDREYLAEQIHDICGEYPRLEYLKPFTARCKGQSISVFHAPDEPKIFLISNNVTVVFSDTSLKPPRPLAARTEKKLLIGIPPELHNWYKNQAVERSTSANQVMITALQAYAT